MTLSWLKTEYMSSRYGEAKKPVSDILVYSFFRGQAAQSLFWVDTCMMEILSFILT